MLKIFIEMFFSSIAIIVIKCFLDDIDIKLKMLFKLFIVYILIFPTLFIADRSSDLDLFFQVIYIISPICIALGVFGISKIKSIMLIYLMYDGIMFYLYCLSVSTLLFLNVTKLVSDIVDVSMYVISLSLILFIHSSSDKYSNLRIIGTIPKRSKILAIVCLWISGFLCIFIRIGLETVEHTKTIVAIYTLSITLITIIGILFPITIIYNFSKDQYKLLSKTYETQARAQANQCESIIKSSNDVRKFKHDFGNYNIGLKGLLEGKKYDEALTLVKFFDDKIDNSKLNPYDTNNNIVDAILYEKQHRATKSNTIIKFGGILPPSGIDIEDLCIIFGVPLDNAIEACEKIDNGKEKVISVFVQPKGICLRITITNPVMDNVKIDNNHIKTTKDDTLNHGIGLFSLKKSVEKHEGILDISCYDNIFKVDITLFSWLD